MASVSEDLWRLYKSEDLHEFSTLEIEALRRGVANPGQE